MVVEQAETYLENAKECMDDGEYERARLWVELAKAEALITLAFTLDLVVQPPNSRVEFVLHAETQIVG